MSLINPSGPTFISYRRADGSDHAADAARRLRASGVPVWVDRDDLPPGETGTRLHEALAGGVAGALLVATPQLGVRKHPDFIHDLEAPTILDTLAAGGAVITVLNTIEDAAGMVDRDAPDSLYGRLGVSTFTQYSAIDGSLDQMGRDLAHDRLRRLRAQRGSQPLLIDLQTRVAATAFGSGADLVFRTVPPVDSRLPPRIVWEDLARFTSWLPHVVDDQAATEVRLTGGAHLSVAYAIGAALPITASVLLTARATDGAIWRVSDRSSPWLRRLLGLRLTVRKTGWRDASQALAVLVDLVPGTPPPTFEEHLAAHPDDYGEAVILNADRWMDHQTGPWLVTQTAKLVRELAARHDAEVHLFLRTPWCAAALLGALLNTIRATLYEWDNTLAKPRYVRTITVAPGLPSPITAVHSPVALM